MSPSSEQLLAWLHNEALALTHTTVALETTLTSWTMEPNATTRGELDAALRQATSAWDGYIGGVGRMLAEADSTQGEP